MKINFTVLLILTLIVRTSYSQELQPPSNLQLYADGFDVYLSWDAPEEPLELVGYNIYRETMNIGFTPDTNYIDINSTACEHSFYITALYNSGESGPSNIMEIYLTPCWIEIYSDEFDNYIPGQQLACQNMTNWTTWSNEPCSDEDAWVTDEVSSSENNSVKIENLTDLVYPINNLTNNIYTIRFKMYIPEGHDGYFNTLQEFNFASSSWGMQVFFDEGGQGSIDAGGASAANFTFPYDTWFMNEINIDMLLDWAEYSIDTVPVHSWIWSTGAFGNGSLNQLGGSNFWAYIGSSGQSGFFIDDYLFGVPSLCIPGPPTNLAQGLTGNNVTLNWTAPGGNCDLLGFNIYRDSTLIGYTTAISYVDTNLSSGIYSYFVTAVYAGYESYPSEEVLVSIITNITESDFDLIKIYPNPANEILTIQSPIVIEKLILVDMAGRTMLNKEINRMKKEIILPVAEYNTGIYFLKIETEEYTCFKRLMIR